jgi:hypothetical protein
VVEELTAPASARRIASVGRQLFISDFIGLGNRLEALAFAYTIRDRFGHEIVLEWPELDSFGVQGARRGPMRPWHRLNSIKLRDCDAATFQSLGRYRNIALRGLTGAPVEEVARAAKRVAADLRLHPRLAEAVRALFADAQKERRPVVGLQMRRGDFLGADLPVFDTTRRYAAVPDWWFQWAMERIRAARPETLFYIAGTGDPTALPWLAPFDCLFLREESRYQYKGPTHASVADPVGELFALACCPTILATPASSFAHWAANILGPPARVVLPRAMTRQDSPEMVQLTEKCSVFGDWVNATRTSPSTTPFRPEEVGDTAQPPQTDWIES